MRVFPRVRWQSSARRRSVGCSLPAGRRGPLRCMQLVRTAFNINDDGDPNGRHVDAQLTQGRKVAAPAVSMAFAPRRRSER